VDKLKILIIDDDKFDRMNYRHILEKNTDFLAEVLEADSSSKGIQLAEEEAVDCILLDYQLPDMDGIHIARAIRRKNTEPLAIIMLTGRGNENIAATAIKEGVSDYIVKNELNSRLLITSIINNVNKCQLEKQIKRNRDLEEKNRIAAEQYYLKNELLENVSHELRTPLNVIMGFTNLLFDGTLGSINEDQKSALNNILSSSAQLLELITNVINITEMDSYRVTFTAEKTDVSKLIFSIVDIVKSAAISKNIQITSDIEKNFPTVYIDPFHFTQVLKNYLSNAIKFTTEPGYIIIRIKSESATTFRLEVEDNGIGIKPEDINKLFGLFQQLDASTTKKYGGIGLGLALVKRIVEMQGGEVGVTSLFGKGSVFYATFKKI